MKNIVKHFITSLLVLQASYLTFYLAFTGSNYQRKTYDLGLISSDFHSFNKNSNTTKKNRSKSVADVCSFIF